MTPSIVEKVNKSDVIRQRHKFLMTYMETTVATLNKVRLCVELLLKAESRTFIIVQIYGKIRCSTEIHLLSASSEQRFQRLPGKLATYVL